MLCSKFPPILLLAAAFCFVAAPGSSDTLRLGGIDNGAPGWEWSGFAKDNPVAIQIEGRESAGGGFSLSAHGILPDDGTGTTWGGVMLRAPYEGAPPMDFSSWSALRFRAATSTPGYYSVRIEQESVGYNATNVIFPVDEQLQEMLIPLPDFRTGVSKSTAIVFTMYVDVPGAEFDLQLEDIALVRGTQAAQAAARRERFANWAPTVAIARQNAQFHHKPILYYFTSRFARTSREFEAQLLADSEFATLSRDFVLCLVDVDEQTELARNVGVYRVPAFLVGEASPQPDSHALYAGRDTSLIKRSMSEHLASRPDSGSTPQMTQGASYYHVLVDDFSDRNDINEVGGRWGTFDAGNSGAITHRFTEMSPGNIALVASGTFPRADAGGTWGGVFTDVTPDRARPENLSAFLWLAFICRSEVPAMYQVHLENGPEQQSIIYTFPATASPERIVIPIAGFGPIASQVTTIVWTRQNPQPGDQFHLVLDDLMVVR